MLITLVLLPFILPTRSLSFLSLILLPTVSIKELYADQKLHADQELYADQKLHANHTRIIAIHLAHSLSLLPLSHRLVSRLDLHCCLLSGGRILER